MEPRDPRFTYPPPLNGIQLTRLTERVKDYQLAHGSLIKLTRSSTEHSVLSKPIGVSIFPSLFPRTCFDAAIMLQKTFNQLYASVACDEAWLTVTLKELVEHDEFAATLWKIHQAIRAERPFSQPLELGIFRSDYMLQHLERIEQRNVPQSYPTELQLKQIEFNTYSCAGGAHGNIISNMHRNLAKQGAYRECSDTYADILAPANMPLNETIKSLALGLAKAWVAYGQPKSQETKISGTCILMIVQPDNINVCDELPLVFALWESDPVVPTFRIEFGAETLAATRLTATGELLYQLDSSSPVWEVALIYMRAGYDPDEYTQPGVACRLRLERSVAVKCPSILTHLCTFKKVQQALTDWSALLRFLSAKEATAISATFAPIYALDDSVNGRHARKLALDPILAPNYVLKPSLEGGGHNIYGENIPDFLADVPERLWPNYVLMKMIEPPKGINNIIMSQHGLYDGQTKFELGIFGTCMWQRDLDGRARIQENTVAGCSLKTKPVAVDEMSVIKGYGAFDSPCLVDMDSFNMFICED